MLKKSVTGFGVFSIASGAMISSGIFILPGMAFAMAGPAVSLSYFLAGVVAMLGILSTIELSTAMPRAGGHYFFINITFGSLLGTVTGFLGWAALTLKSAFAVFGMAEIIFIYTGISHILSGLVVSLVFIVFNILGIKKATAFQNVLVYALLLLLVLFVLFGMPQVETGRYTPFLTDGINQVFITTAFVFVSFGGLLKTATVSEEVINPKKNLPLGIIGALAAVTIIYALVTMVITGMLEPGQFKESLTPVADAAGSFMGAPGYTVIIIASLLAFISTGNAGLLSAARFPLALSRDQLLPEALSSVNRKYNTPTLSIIITGLAIFLALLLPLEVLVKAASAVVLAAYVLTNSAVIVLRESRLVNYRPSFKAPFYPWLQVLSIFIFLALIIDLGMEALEITLGLVVLSLIFYVFYGRKRSRRESALLYLVNRVCACKTTGNILEDELREIIIERDDIKQDFIDELIKDAIFLDMKGPIKEEDALKRTGREMASKTDGKEETFSRLWSGDDDYSKIYTADFYAVQHTIIDNVHNVQLIAIRSREGIDISRTGDRVNALFVLLGPEEQRKQMFKAVEAIFSLIEQQDFKKTWLTMKDHVQLKNLLVFKRKDHSA